MSHWEKDHGRDIDELLASKDIWPTLLVKSIDGESMAGVKYEVVREKFEDSGQTFHVTLSTVHTLLSSYFFFRI